MQSRRAELGLLGGLFLLAIAVRSAYLWEIPRFTDEIVEESLAARSALGQSLPLTNIDPYIGAFWNYLLAAIFRFFGPNIYSPRVVVLILGALSVVPTYLLARSIGGHAVGLLAGTLLALAP